MKESFTITPLGDSAVTISFGNVIEERLNRKVVAFSAALEKAAITGIKDVIPAYSSITIHYDVYEIIKSHANTSAFTYIKSRLENILLQEPENLFLESRKIKIPVCYAAPFSPDIKEVAAQASTTIEEVILLHTSRTYLVFMVGFLPGFAYMGEVDERIAVPRRLEPRLKIDAGSVGIAGKQTGIYPLTSPGGWQIIGRTPLKLFDAKKTDPVLFQAGDKVEFFSIPEDEFDNY